MKVYLLKTGKIAVFLYFNGEGYGWGWWTLRSLLPSGSSRPRFVLLQL